MHSPSFSTGNTFRLTLTNQRTPKLRDTPPQHQSSYQITSSCIGLVFFEELNDNTTLGQLSNNIAEINV